MMNGNISRDELRYTAENLMFIVTERTDLKIEWKGKLKFEIGVNTREMPYVVSTTDKNGNLKSIRICVTDHDKNTVYREFFVENFYSLDEIESILRPAMPTILLDIKRKLHNRGK